MLLIRYLQRSRESEGNGRTLPGTGRTLPGSHSGGQNLPQPGQSHLHGIRLSGPALGCPEKGDARKKVQDYKDECERVEVEHRFSLAKRKCSMGLVTAKLQETPAHVLAMSVLVLNLRKIQYARLRLLTHLWDIFTPKEKLTIVQQVLFIGIKLLHMILVLV